MIRKFGLLAALIAAAPALAQTQSPSAQPSAPAADPRPAIEQASEAFGQCIATGVQNVAATVAPEAGATGVLGGCATQRQALDQAVESLLAAMPEDRKAAAREQVRTHMAELETQIATAIRESRAAPAAAPTPAPAQ